MWPARMLYRDFCPVDFKRPSGFLYVTNASWENANLGLIHWRYEAELTLFAATDDYTVESTETLRADQQAVLAAFSGPALQVGDRHIIITVAAQAPGPGEAYVTFAADWFDSRPGYLDSDVEPESVSGVPLMEDFELKTITKE
jgi:hypothetical protein